MNDQVSLESSVAIRQESLPGNPVVTPVKEVKSQEKDKNVLDIKVTH